MKQKFYRKILKNGMTLVFEKREVPVVSVAFAVRYGGINEIISERGVAHFIEHMLFKGTPTRNSHQIAEEIEKKGGDLNGFTEEIVTAYWCKMPSKHLNTALEVLGDMVKNPKFDEKEIEKEKHVIFEEMKLYKDNPIKYVFEEIQKALYKPPLGNPLIGDEKTVGDLTRKKIVKIFNEIYQPNNMVLCVVGDADFKEIVDFVEKSFPKKKGKIPGFTIEKRNYTKIEKRKGIDQANLVFAHHIPTAKDKKNYAAFVLNVLMAGGMSSRLFSEIRQKRNLAYGVKGNAAIHKDFAYSYFYIGAKKENVEKIKKLILEELKKVAKDLEEKELNQIKEQIIGNHYIMMEDSADHMSRLLLHEINGNAKDLYEFEKNIRAVKLKDVKDLAKIKDYSFFALVPE